MEQSRGLRTVDLVVSSVWGCDRTGHNRVERSAPGRDRGSDRGSDGWSPAALLLRSISVGLGLCGAVILRGEKEHDGAPVPRRFAERFVPSAHCASPYKPDSPRYKYNFIADVVEKSTPAVVSIEIIGR